jgi:hypothetical protein
MFRFEPFLLALLVAGLAPATAAAESMTASLEAGTERAPRDFSRAVLNYDIATLTEMYDSGLSWTAFAQNSRVAHNGPNVWALEAMLGYRYAFSRYLVYGSAGFGERLIKPHDIAYATFRFGMDATLSRSFTWNALNLRYRDGLDRDVVYRSSVAGTGVTWRATEDTALYTRVFAVFDTQDRFAGTGLGLGLRRFF